MAQAQREREFASAQLSDVAAELAGSSQNWPIVSDLAEYNPETNRFKLTRASLEVLSEFLIVWNEVSASRTVYHQLVTEGGRVFAPDQLNRIDSLFTLHRQRINTAETKPGIETGREIVTAIAQAKAMIDSRRTQDIEARLEQQSGRVERRRGLISEWTGADVNELFRRQDGIRTGAESQAQLVFLDGSDVVLSENTTATIRESRLDRLTNRSEVEIDLSSGGILTRLSAAARNQSDYTLNAGSSTSSVRSNNFWAESQSADRVIMSNFDGEVVVQAEDASVTLQENEGTVVVRGREPEAPVRLLPAPQVARAKGDTVVYAANFAIQWQPIEGAVYYEVDISTSQTFVSNSRTFRSDGASFSIPQVQSGLNFIQVRAYDRNGLRGNNSSAVRVIRIQSDVPPPLMLDNRARPTIYTVSPVYQLTGTTEPGAVLKINGRQHPVDENGRFAIPIEASGEITLKIDATNATGKTRSVQQKLIKIEDAQLFDLRWSVPVSGLEVKKMPRILVSGQAQEFLVVEILIGGRTFTMPVGSSGEWARQLTTGDAEEITITFRDRASGTMIAQRTFRLIP